MLAINPSDLPVVAAYPGRRNKLLNCLDLEEHRLISPHLDPVGFTAGDVLHGADAAIDFVYFLDGGLASIARPISSQVAVEIGLVGVEGMIGAGLALMSDRTPFLSRIVLPGEGQRMRASAFRDALARSTVLRTTVLRYAQAFTVQLAETAACNAKQALDARVARWLLMCQDRLGRDEIDVTHATIAANLAVRRAGVTDALHVLEGDRAIRSLRGRIVILDRPGLEAAANGSYGIAEAEYHRLLPARNAMTVMG